VRDWVVNSPSVRSFNVLLSSAESSDSDYASLVGGPSVAASVSNIDEAHLVVCDVGDSGAEGALSVSEGGSESTFSVRLTARPAVAVTVAVTSGRVAEALIVTSQIVFSSLGWSTCQTATVRGVNEFVDDGDQSFVVSMSTSSEDGFYVGLTASVSGVNADDDVSGVSVSSQSAPVLAVSESGSTATFGVVLTSEPTAAVVVGVSLDLAAAMSGQPVSAALSVSSLSFSASNWNREQTVTVTGVRDWVVNSVSVRSFNAVLSSSGSSDVLYAGLSSLPSVVSSVENVDVASLVLASPEGGLLTNETGVSTTFSVKLSARTYSSVTVSLSSSRESEAVVSPSSVVFVSAAWDSALTVTVTGVNDWVIDHGQSLLVSLVSSSEDAFYVDLRASIGDENADNDYARVYVSSRSADVLAVS